MAVSIWVLTLLFSYTALIAGNNPGKKTTVKTTSLNVDPSKSQLTWNAKKVGGEHTGNVKLSKGTLIVQGSKLTGGVFVMDMTSITDTDLTNASFNEKMTTHLKSEDSFSVENYPTFIFKITKAEPMAKVKTGEAFYTVTGDLTIKGITHSVSFPATVKINGNAA